MRKIILIFIAIMALFPSVMAWSAEDKPSSEVPLKYYKKGHDTKVERSIFRLDISVTYHSETHLLEVNADDIEAEVFLYLNDNVVGYNSEINTTFQIEEPGIYRIEILGESWIAEGSLQV